MGIGNVLLQDDGIGVWLTRELKNMPGDIQVHEIGISVFSLFHIIPQDNARIIFVDALTEGQQPGTIYCFSSDQELIPSTKEKHPISLHQFRLEEVLSLLNQQTRGMKWKIFGVEPASIDYGHGLSPCLQAQFPDIFYAFEAEINHFFIKEKVKS